MTTLLSAALAFALLAPPPAAPVKRVEGKSQRSWPKKGEDASRGGTRRGVVEIGLGVFAAGASGLLIGRGAWEVVQGNKLMKECENFETSEFLCARPNPRLGHDIAAGLSLSFAVPMAVAAGLLLARGVRIEKDRRRFLRRTAWAPRAGGLAVHF